MSLDGKPLLTDPHHYTDAAQANTNTSTNSPVTQTPLDDTESQQGQNEEVHTMVSIVSRNLTEKKSLFIYGFI